MLIQLLYFQMALAFKERPCDIRYKDTRFSGQTLHLYKFRFPGFPIGRDLESSFCPQPVKATSCHASGTAGKTLILPPQLCNNISCIDCAPDNGVSITGPDSLYNVFTLKNVQTAYSNKPMHHSLFPVQMRWKKLRSMNNPDELRSSIARNEEISQ